jgi:hypothetical protein
MSIFDDLDKFRAYNGNSVDSLAQSIFNGQKQAPSAFDYSLVDGSNIPQSQEGNFDFGSKIQGYLNNWTQNAAQNPLNAFSQPMPPGVTVTGGK